MLKQYPIYLLFFSSLLLTSCSTDTDQPPSTLLTGRAILPADTIVPGPPVGIALGSEINGRTLPLPGVPVQGFSSIIHQSGNNYLALQDNGFGTRANSPDVPLQWFHLKIELAENPKNKGQIIHTGHTFITDPDGFIPDSPSDGKLTGAHLDPESFVQLADGTFWIGEEFGPFLFHTDSLGRVLEAPVSIPVASPLLQLRRGNNFLRTPDHPDLRHEAEAEQLANLPRSGGIEGLALSPDGKFIYASVEKAMIEDPSLRRRFILQFNPESKKFTNEFRLYKVDAPNVSIASLEAFGESGFLVLERDTGEGANALIKRIYQINWDDWQRDGTLNKTLVCDLMHIRDKAGFTTMEEGAIGLGSNYTFPYVTPECLLILDPQNLLVVNDNNYPMSSGRRPPSTPDDNEFIRLRLSKKLKQ